MAQSLSASPMNPMITMWDMWMTSQRNYLQMWQRAFMPPRPMALREMPFGQQQYSERSRTEQHVVSNGAEQVIPIVEESLDVSTRRIEGATTRVRRVVRERPVARQVQLHDETVVVERKEPNGEAANFDSLIEREYAMSDSREVPIVTKQVRVRGNVVLRKETNNRTEVVRDVVRYSDVEIEQPQRMPVVPAAQHVTVREHHEQPAGESVQMREHHEHHKTEQKAASEQQPVSGFQAGSETHREHDEHHEEHHQENVRERQE